VDGKKSHARADTLRAELDKLRDASTRAETDEKTLADALRTLNAHWLPPMTA